MKRKLNLKKSPKDSRDYSLEFFLESNIKLPDEFDSGIKMPVLDQQSSDMCLAFQIALMKTNQENIPMSPGWIYYFAHMLDPRKNEGGLYPQYAFEALRKKGIAKREHFNPVGNFDEVKDKLTPEIYQMILEYSKKYGIKNWVRVTGSTEAIKRAIYNEGKGKYVIMAIPVYKEFLEAKEFVGKPDLNGKMFGGHAIGTSQYLKDGFKIINTWGKDWGIDGKTTLGYDYPIWEAYIAFDKEPDYPEDIIGHWNEDLLKKAFKKNLLKGYPDGLLKPNREVTRAEIVSILDTVGLL